MKLARVLAAPAGLALASLIACSDPPAEPAQGALTVFVGSVDKCQSTHGQVNLPPQIAVFDQLHCDLSKPGCSPSGIVAVNRSENNDVSCRVKPSGDGYDVSLKISHQPDVLLTANGVIGASGGTMTVVESAAQGGGTPISDSACKISVIPNFGTVKPGAIWARFECTNAQISGDPGGAVCSIEGAFIFENCDK